MKTVRLHAYGDASNFRVEDLPEPIAGPGEVLVRIAVSGLNPVDAYLRLGYMAQFVPLQFPAILGLDAAGTVVAPGPGVEGFAAGDRVLVKMPLGRGAQAELVAVPVGGLARLPASVGFEAAATLPLAGLTARVTVDAVNPSKGERVLVSGALGAVGRAAVMFLKQIGARPVAGVRGDRLDEGRALAGDAVAIDGPVTPTFDRAISAAAPAAAATIGLVRDGGTVASIVPVPEGANPGDRVTILGLGAKDDAVVLQAIADAAGRGELTIPIALRFPLTELVEAHAALARGPRGKILMLH